ncbi:aldehyde dehydrogenase family protein [Azospira restricta]|uniref:aldehyde dehydrogenase (NAD(+)) n=1 Tax=Azospira restricta TaxID=404405 RepID=A0A974SPW3_9RHOO|nr:aldehyde dehydrogenase family protein [Azospira restricta]QRJ64272.1 aldehyde dehydrogenase family protein [Azospira restricta]
MPHRTESETLLERLGIEELNPATALGDGSWRAGVGGFASIDPAVGEPLTMVQRAMPDDLEMAVAAAVRVFRHWREVPAPRRGLFVRDLADALRDRKDDLGTLIALETGKIKAEADGEVQEMIDIADFAVGLSRRLEGSVLASERPQHRLFEQWHPLGPVAVITAFNFPAAVWAWNAMIAAVCGDTVIWKPSPKAPLTAIAVQRIADEVASRHGAGGVFSLLLSDETWPVAGLAADGRVPLVSFTGSSAVGKKIAPLVAARFGRCLLECSGNNAVIVDESADLELALPAIVFGAVGTAGQRCTTTRRLFIHQRRWDETVERLLHAWRQLRVGDPLDPHTLLGPLIDEEARRAFVAAVAEAKAAGGELLHGGKALPGHGFYVEPTLLRADNGWPVVQRETFAPLLYLMPFARIDDAIRLQNAVPQGLSSALFTNDLRHAERFVAAAGSDCGIANVNLGTSGAEVGGAFGGEKETGGGREAGSDAWKAYMRRQTSTINWGSTLPLAQGIEFRVPSTKTDADP